MSFDPCGTRKLEGEDIIKRLAEYLDVTPDGLRIGLEIIARQAQKDLDTLMGKMPEENNK